MATRKPPIPDERTKARQAQASDPNTSAWVSAHAGSGKTWVLATRVIRLLLDKTDPARILCLTYTKAAASEMKNRVFERLAAWSTMPADKLAAEVAGLTGGPASPALVAYARTLFARALETPGGLKIQTIHAFCESLLHRFPLEANIAGHFEMLDEAGASFLMAEARRSILAGTGNAQAHDACIRLLDISGETGLDALLDEIIGKRQVLQPLIDALGTEDTRLANFCELFGLTPADLDTDAIMSTAWPLNGFDPAELADAGSPLRSIKLKTPADFVSSLAEAGGMTDPVQRYEVLCQAFLKDKGKPRSFGNHLKGDALEKVPDFQTRIDDGLAHILDVQSQLHLAREITATLDVLAVADALIDRYEAMKRARGLLDFDDLIHRTKTMLQRTGASAWVRYKLDQGIDHVLVDEAQDTSPPQWQVIQSLTDEFFAPGSSRSDTLRTIFAVGDEKQSIYSFQGADPAQFGRSREHYAKAAKTAESRFEPLELDASFRSTAAVLGAVDTVFAVAENRKGLTVDLAGSELHRSLRLNEPGRVEIWARIMAEKSEPSDDWNEPHSQEALPAVKVAERIAETIKRWIDEGAVLESTGAAITPGDILVLVRNRTGPFVTTLSRRLKTLGVPVAGADRLKMGEHIAFKDLVALARVMMQPADDLSLAALLKSPLFGLSERSLFDLAHGRGGDRLHDRLAEAPEGTPEAQAFATLSALRTIAHDRPPHAFFAHVLSALGGREKLVGRLGPETGDVLDEFMQLTLTAEKAGIADLQRFVAIVENDAPQIKREMDRAAGEVRIMTVHGAKGLEAPIVFLVDRGGRVFNTAHAPALVETGHTLSDDQDVPVLLWRKLPDVKSDIVAQALEREKSAAEDEYRRLLYVGMTRAADRLILCGFGGKNEEKAPTWHTMVMKALGEHCDAKGEADEIIWTYPKGLGPVPTGRTAVEDKAPASFALPAGFAERAPPEPPPVRPLTPSGASGLAADAGDAATKGDTSVPLLERGATGGSASKPGMTALIGTVTHTLLQALPDLPPPVRRERAIAYASAATNFSGRQLDAIVDPVMAVLEDPALADLFGPHTRAEVPIMGLVTIGGTERAVSGVIDRIAVTDISVTLADYKTNRIVPERAAGLPDVHVRQMALYRALVAPLWPGRAIVCMLVYTGGPVAITVPPAALDAAIARLAQGQESG